MLIRQSAGPAGRDEHTDGRWEGRVVVDYNEKGRPGTKSALAHTKEECLQKLETLRTRCGIVTGKARPDRPFGDWLDRWYQELAKPRLRPKSREDY